MTGDAAVALYSTLATSSAALVAIIGGFLVARLVSLSAERDGMQRRRRNHSRDLDDAQRDLDRAIADRRAADHRRFNESMAGYAAAVPDVTAEELVARSQMSTSSHDEMLEYARQLLAAMARARAAIATLPEGTIPDPDQLDLPIAAGDQAAYLAVAAQVALKRRGLMPTSAAWKLQQIAAESLRFNWTDVQMPGPTREERRRARVTELRQLVLLDEEDLRSLGRPHGVRRAVGVLAGMAVGGIGPSIVLLGLDPVPSEPVARWSAIGGFVMSLAALMGYLAWLVRDMQRTGEAP